MEGSPAANKGCSESVAAQAVSPVLCISKEPEASGWGLLGRASCDFRSQIAGRPSKPECIWPLGLCFVWLSWLLGPSASLCLTCRASRSRTPAGRPLLVGTGRGQKLRSGAWALVLHVGWLLPSLRVLRVNAMSMMLSASMESSPFRLRLRRARCWMSRSWKDKVTELCSKCHMYMKEAQWLLTRSPEEHSTPTGQASNMCHSSHSVQPLKLPRRADLPLEEGWGDGWPSGRVRSVTGVTAKVASH